MKNHFGIAMAMRRHAMKKRLPHGGAEDEKLHPEAEPLKPSLAEHLMAKEGMNDGGMVEDPEKDPDFPESGETPRQDAFLSEDMDPESSGLDDAETDTYPTNGTEHETSEDGPKKKMVAMMAAMRKRRSG